MKFVGLLLIVIIIIAAGLTFLYGNYGRQETRDKDDFFFGVSFGSKTAEEAKLLIDKVKLYTNFFVVASWDITTNETALNEVCRYAVKANLSFIVFFDYILPQAYPWHTRWLDTAKEMYGQNFLGVYLYDEPGGKQIDTGQWDEGDFLLSAFSNISDYDEAANIFVDTMTSSPITQEVTGRNLRMLTSDYALYWFDYLGGYDTVFAELGWNHSSVQQIALDRGAAKVQGKEWGAIITWTYDKHPYLVNGSEMFQEMISAYSAGTKYVIVFNYPTFPEDNLYGVLSAEHFEAMENFHEYINNNPRNINGKSEGHVAFVLPKNYGWGMRYQEDKMWGFWSADEKAQLIWNNMNKLIQKYGFDLDIVYDDSRFNFQGKYDTVYFWNSTIP